VQTYRYYANFAVAVAEGEISGIGRIWADGREIDRSQIVHRVYLGSETQESDSLISAREGASSAPAYRGTAYVVFERLALEAFGNRMPQLSFEVYRAVEAFGSEIRAVVLIPAGEFVLAPGRCRGPRRLSPSVHTRQGGTDWTVSLDQLEATLPNAKSISLVVSWFGTDLRRALRIEARVRPLPSDDFRRVKVAVQTARLLRGRREGRSRRHAVRPKRHRRDPRSAGPGRRHADAVRADGRGGGNALPDPYGGTAQAFYPGAGASRRSGAGEPGS
jgi:hypothetical protein